ncbi:HNH endonuclease [bacterium]|nr:MAG: HNH endonuclease [bacterium]
MAETLEDIERKIRAVEADIQDVKNAQRARGTPFTEREERLLLAFNEQLAELRKKENNLRAVAIAAETGKELYLFLLIFLCTANDSFCFCPAVPPSKVVLTVTHWATGIRHVVVYQPSQSLQNFLAELSIKFDTPISRLYNLPSCALWEAKRQVISDEQLLDVVNELKQLPIVEAADRLFVSSDTNSPTGSPKRVQTFQAVNNGSALPSQSDGMTGNSRASSRALQHTLRECLLERDGGRCLVCGCDEKRILQAAHVIGASEQIPLKQLANEFGLANKYELRVGLLLCSSCHIKFDNNLLGIDGDGNVYEKMGGEVKMVKCIFDGIDEDRRLHHYPSRNILEWKYKKFTDSVQPISRRKRARASAQERQPRKKKAT